MSLSRHEQLVSFHNKVYRELCGEKVCLLVIRLVPKHENHFYKNKKWSYIYKSIFIYLQIHTYH